MRGEETVTHNLLLRILEKQDRHSEAIQLAAQAIAQLSERHRELQSSLIRGRLASPQRNRHLHLISRRVKFGMLQGAASATAFTMMMHGNGGEKLFDIVQRLLSLM